MHYICQTFTMNPDGTPAAPLRMETGFWRPNVDTRKVDVLMLPRRLGRGVDREHRRRQDRAGHRRGGSY
ncbi:hypothetical protein JCM18909_2181 [Cutibacterium acnes JCM 18909]|nr:hypothetical protein JCM18909_2181 [Cutibacterium acnes JCM 18909]GAE77231.1 hypothetical protein JCM18918_3090 [Cutibacterium acnes JCM 18918]